MPKPIVAIVGRPNVGKSTLFNRIVGQPLAIVDEAAGTTRDRIYADAEWNGVPFTLVDTGGLEIECSDRPNDLMAQVRAQAQVAIAEADAIIFMTDIKEGLMPGDQDVAGILHRSAKPVILAVNKADNPVRRREASEFYQLGIAPLFPISAVHGTGTGDLLDEVVASFPPSEEGIEMEAAKIAIVGRPNVGKSLLLNKLLGQERAIVSEVPGTTRDAIDTFLEWEETPLMLIDTAGIRRRGRIAPGVEKYSVIRALRAIGRADVVLLLLDALDGVTDQDTHIAGFCLEEAKGVIIVANKWDLVEKDTYTMQNYTRYIRANLKFLSYAPLIFVSALTGQRVSEVLPLALQVRQERFVRIPTGELNRILLDAMASHAPPSKAGRQLKIYYATQATVDPPTFVFFANDPRLVHFSYKRYLENRLRKHYGFIGTPLLLKFKKRRR